MFTIDKTADQLTAGDTIFGADEDLSPLVVSVKVNGYGVDVVVEWNDGSRHPRPWQFDVADIVRVIPAAV